MKCGQKVLGANLQEGNALLGLGVEEGNALLETLFVGLPGLQQLCLPRAISAGQCRLQLWILNQTSNEITAVQALQVKQAVKETVS